MEMHNYILVFFASLLMVSIFIKLLFDNRHELGLLFSPTIIIKTLYSWSLMGVIILTFLTLNYFGSNYMRALVYKNGIDDICVDEKSRGPCREDRLRNNFYIKNATEHKQAIISGENAISELEQITKENIGQASDKAGQAWISSTPDKLPGTNHNKCKFYDVFCKIANKIKTRLNNWYLNKRTQKKSQIENRVQEMEDAGEVEVENLSVEGKKYVNEQVMNSQRTTTTSLKRIFMAWDIYQFISTLILTLVAIKTFLMVMGRVIYARGSDKKNAKNTIRFLNSNPHKKDNIEIFPDKKSLSLGDLSKPDIFFVALFKNVSDTDERFRIKQKFTLIFSRLFSRYLMKKVIIDEDSARDPSITSDAARSYVAWELEKGNEVIFDMRKLIVFSDSITLKRHISLRLGTLVFGKVFYTKAIGSGYLIFEAKGLATANDQSDALKSVNYNRHIAHDISTQFSLDVSLNPFDTLLTGVNVARSATTGGIVDMCPEGKFRAGLGRFLRYFIVPF